MIKFICDHCPSEVENEDLIQSSDIIQVARSLKGNDRGGAGSLIPPSKGKHYCNRCYKILLEWTEGDLRKYIRDHFPLEET